MRWFFPLGIVLLACAYTAPAQAAGYFGPRSEYSPSVFTYGFRGFAIGALAGTATGYVIARDDGFASDDWKPVVYGLGIGALGGAAIGLTLGFIDLEDDRPGMGNIALRDMLYGAVFGLVAGAIVGGLVAIGEEDAELVLFGAALGTFGGTLVGLVVGIIEGRRIVDSPSHRYPGQRIAPVFALAPERGGGGRLQLGAALAF
jgi:hypothetical protein